MTEKEASVIKFDNVSKRFRLGQKLLLKEALLDILNPSAVDYFWALKDVGFEVKRGEILGILGKNGSGKSTILKLIAGIMVPTRGRVYVQGRIAPLIELGAGFHPELSGRENIYINGAILGLTEKEVAKRFADIVEFSELSEFIDTPVKHYSSGMYVRLGFAIAINVNPNILLVDEILTVGDEKFRKKCMKKMEEFVKQEITIIYVSHDLRTMKDFCSRVIELERGIVVNDGKPTEVIQSYAKKNT
jgi:ABC-type polysaccharide/polyol phosphate transport system ATPase subunit